MTVDPEPAPGGPARIPELRLLGPLELADPEGRVVATRSLPLLLLAYLALERRAVPRGSLARLFWPASEPERARHSLRQTLLRIRGLLPEAIESDEDWVRVVPGSVGLDLHRMEGAVWRGEVEEALGLWRGEPLGIADRSLGWEMEEWCEGRREEWAELLRMAVIESVERGAGPEDSARALPVVDRALAHFPMNGRLLLLRGRMLAAAGLWAGLSGWIARLEAEGEGEIAGELRRLMEDRRGQPPGAEEVDPAPAEAERPRPDAARPLPHARSRERGYRSEGGRARVRPRLARAAVVAGALVAGGGGWALYAGGAARAPLPDVVLCSAEIPRASAAGSEAGELSFSLYLWSGVRRSMERIAAESGPCDQENLIQAPPGRPGRLRRVAREESRLRILEYSISPSGIRADWIVDTLALLGPMAPEALPPEEPAAALRAGRNLAIRLPWQGEDARTHTEILLLDLESGGLERRIRAEGVEGHPAPATFVADRSFLVPLGSNGGEGWPAVWIDGATGALEPYRGPPGAFPTVSGWHAMAVDGTGRELHPIEIGRNGDQEDGSLEIWLHDRASGAWEQLTRNGWNDYNADLSEDGRFLCWQSEERGHYHSDIMVMDLRTRRSWNLTRSDAFEFDCHISPDGAWVLYQRRALLDHVMELRPIRGGEPVLVGRSDGAGISRFATFIQPVEEAAIHPRRISQTRIEVDGERAEISFRVDREDLEAVIRESALNPRLRLDGSAATAREIGTYLARTLMLEADGTPLSLQLERSEAEDEIWHLSLRAEAPAPIQRLLVRHHALVEAFADQRNVVRVIHRPSGTEHMVFFTRRKERYRIEVAETG